MYPECLLAHGSDQTHTEAVLLLSCQANPAWGPAVAALGLEVSVSQLSSVWAVRRELQFC